jgi:hypothetical protein
MTRNPLLGEGRSWVLCRGWCTAVVRVLLALGLCSVIASCSSLESTTASEAGSPGSTVLAWSEEAGPVVGPAVPWSEEQKAAMEDGTVTSEEYHEAFRRYATCLSDKGFEFGFVEDRGDRIDIAIPDAAVQAGADSYCYEREFRGVDMRWQLTHEDPADTERYRSCLEQLGLDVPDTQDEMIDVLRSNGIDLGTCSEKTDGAGG